MRKKRFVAFLLSMAMAGTSLYTCGVIDVQAAAVENEEAENPNLEQLLELQSEAAALDETDPEEQDLDQIIEPGSEEEPEIQAEAGVETISFDGVVDGKAMWGSKVSVNNPSASVNYTYEVGSVSSQSVDFIAPSDAVGKTVTVTATLSADQTVVGSGSYELVKRNLADCSVNFTASANEYDGKAQTPGLIVSDNGLALEDKTVDSEWYTKSWQNNIAPGNARVDLDPSTLGAPYYEGSTFATFSIPKRKIQSVNVVVKGGEYPYTGKPIVPPAGDVTVTNSANIAMVEGRDYSVSWSDNVNVSSNPTATVTLENSGYFVSGNGQAGSFEVKNAFKIIAAAQSFTVKLKDEDGNLANPQSYAYGVSWGQISEWIVVSAGNLPVSSDDYEVSSVIGIKGTTGSLSSDDVPLPGSTYEVTVTGSGNYASGSSGTATFSIIEAAVSSDDLSIDLIDGSSYSYNGSDIEPTVSVNLSVNGDTVTLSDNEYTVSYKNNRNVTNNAQVIVSLNKGGKYTAVSNSVSFNINPADIGDDDAVSVDAVKDPVYNGGPQAPTLSINMVSGNYHLVEGTDYTISEASISQNISANTGYSCVITGSGNFTGTRTVSYDIDPKELTKEMCSIQPAYGFTGEQIRPTVTVSNADLVSGNKTLTISTDYTVSYGDNVNMGTNSGTVTVSGQGNYTGTVELTFNIIPKNFTKVEVSPASYNGEPISLNEFVTVYSDETIVSADQYDILVDNGNVSADNVINAGEYALTISGTNYYYGCTAHAALKVSPSDISANGLKVSISGARVYKGGSKLGSMTVSNDISTSLVDGVDYTISLNDDMDLSSNNLYYGTYELTGKGNYTGSVSGNYEIQKTAFVSENIKIETKKEFVYTGTRIRPSANDFGVIDTLDGDIVLTPDEDYYVMGYTDSVSAGHTASARLAARRQSAYDGSMWHEFVIQPKSLSDNEEVLVEPVSLSADFTGSSQSFNVADDVKNCLSYNGMTLSLNIDYTLRFENADGDEVEAYKDAGEYKIYAVGKGNYDGERLIGVFAVNPGKLVQSNFIMNPETNIYSGEPQKPTIRIRNNIYTENIDYKIVTDMDNMVNVGNYPILISGCGDYENSEVSLNYTITAKQMTNSNTHITYAGKTSSNDIPGRPILVEVTVDGIAGKVAESNYTYTVTSVNSANNIWTVTVSGQGNYSGSATQEVEFAAIELTQNDVSVDELIYNGESQTLSSDQIHVTKGGRTLVEGTDYTLSDFTSAISVNEKVSVTVSGMADYTGTVIAEATIQPISIEKAVVSAADLSYTGALQTPKITVILDGKALLENTDYRVAVLSGNNIDVGRYTATITGMGNYTGTCEVTYSILNATVENAITTILGDPIYYTGGEMRPAEANIQVVVGNTILDPSDYTISYNDAGIDAGPHTFTISGSNNYEGKTTGTYVILPRPLTAAPIAVATVSAATYTGAEQSPQVTVTVDGTQLVEDTDYIVVVPEGSNTTDAGATPILISGNGNYTGMLSAVFTIAPVSIENADVSVDKAVYTGTAQVPVVTAKVGDTTLVMNIDYALEVSANMDMTNAGDYELNILGMGNYTGSHALTFTIDPVSLDDATIGTDETGNITVSVKVDGEDRILTEGSDYTLTTGDGKTTITGIGNYSGERVEETEALKISLAGAVVTAENVTYTGSADKPSVEVLLKGDVVPEDAYEVNVSGDNVNVGSYEVTVTAKEDSRYEGSATGTYRIVPASLEYANVTADPIVYKQVEQTPKATVTLFGKTLVQDVDYIVASTGVQNVGDCDVTVTGLGNYTGTRSGTFEITPASLTGAEVKIDVASYTGKAQTPKVTVIKDGYVVPTSDYTFVPTSATNAGSTTVTVTGRNNYTGTASGKFVINPIDLSTAKVTGIKAKMIYTGKKLKQSAMKVTLSGKQLKLNTDYTVTYTNNKNIGEASLTIKGKGNYSGAISKRTFKIYPAKETIKKLKAGKNRFTVRAKKQSGGVTYQIHYRIKGAKDSTYIRVKSTSVRKVVKNLQKGKTYIVRVRAYKKVGGKMYYGEFSNAKTVKIK